MFFCWCNYVIYITNQASFTIKTRSFRREWELTTDWGTQTELAISSTAIDCMLTELMQLTI